MKKYILYILFVAGSFGMTSCNNFLDVDQYFNDLNQYDSIFTNRDKTEQWLWETYTYLEGTGADISNKASQAFSFASDDLIFGDRIGENGGCKSYQNCEYGPSKMLYEDRWGHFYRGIRTASIFIHNVDKCTQLEKSEIEDYKAQARFLRAYFYWMLMRQWGPVPILPSEGQEINLSYEDLAISRSSFDECVEFTVKEFEDAALHLKPQRSVSWLGMVTRGAALAARAKVLLYAASPLYNGNSDMFDLKDDKGRQLISQTYDERKWARAAAAAEEVMSLNLYELYTADSSKATVLPPAGIRAQKFPLGAGGIDPYLSYRNLFNGTVRAKDNPELIFFRQNYSVEDINSMVRHSYPRNNGMEGWNTNAVSLKQVNAYYMFDGKDKESASTEYPYEESGYATAGTDYKFVHLSDKDVEMVNRRFCNREPRFYASVAFHGCIWESANAIDKDGKKVNGQPCDYYKGGRNGKMLTSPEFFVRTGIGLFKYYNPDDTWETGGVTYVTTKVEPAIRYADVLLWYAEALNELVSGQAYTFDTYDKAGSVSVKRDVPKMSAAFSRVRFRAGLPDATDYADAGQFRVTLKRERQIELFAECSRYFDLRRWKDAPVEESLPMMGMNVDMGLSRKDEFYKVVPTDMPKVWLDKMYLWPLPKNETDRNIKLTQNPGWN